MKEKKRDQQEKQAGAGSGSPFDANPDAGNNLVSVSSGPYVEDLPVAGVPVGEIRRRFADRFDIDQESTPIVNGNEVGDDYTLKPGEQLSFIRRAGEKGATSISIYNETATADKDGSRSSMNLARLADRMSAVPNSGPAVLPTGIKSVFSQGRVVLWFWEQPPRICQLSWIAANSPRPYGPGTIYRNVRIALPYLIIMAVFVLDDQGMPKLALQDECFFRPEPLRSLGDELCYPGLLNCSVMGGDTAPLAWICTQYLKQTRKMNSKDPAERYAAGFEAVRYCLLETSFNLSSEHHEGNSWYGKSKNIDSRIRTVEAWEAATQKNPLFVLEVPWIATGHTIHTIAQRTCGRLGQPSAQVKTADDVARLIFNG